MKYIETGLPTTYIKEVENLWPTRHLTVLVLPTYHQVEMYSYGQPAEPHSLWCARISFTELVGLLTPTPNLIQPGTVDSTAFSPETGLPSPTRSFLSSRLKMSLQAIKYSGGSLAIIDQLQLPHVEKYVQVRNSEEGWQAIKDMRVRGAPAIAIVAALALASELHTLTMQKELSPNASEVRTFVTEKLRFLVSSRPTAVNLSDAARKLTDVVTETAHLPGSSGEMVATAFISAAEQMLVKDVQDNKNIGENGARWILENAVGDNSKATVLTHCNTGSLATSGYGTALGVIRSLALGNSLHHAYCTETRPYNQGSRLTAFELVHDRLPATLITDSMAAALLANPRAGVNAIVVGADRVAGNGDTANKIGTYGLAVLARYHGVKFLVAAPLTTIDPATKSGDAIIIEERPAVEVTTIKGQCEDTKYSGDRDMVTIRLAAEGIDVWNPAFDVTPASLIDGIITENGVVEKDASGVFHLEELF